MRHRVLDHRLQDQGRHARDERVCLGLHVDGQAIGKANPLDFEVALHELQFVRERRFLTARLVEARAQDLAQESDHAHDGGLITLQGQHGHGVERVEQHVRIDLRTQARQPGIGEARLQRRRLPLALARLGVVAKRMRGASDDNVNQQIHHDGEAEDLEETGREGELCEADRAHDGDRKGMDEAERERCDDVNGDRLCARRPFRSANDARARPASA